MASKKNNSSVENTIFIIFVLAIIFTEIALWDTQRFRTENYYYWIIGFLGVAFLFFKTQRIISANKFKNYFLFSVFCLVLGFIKMLLSCTNSYHVLAAAIPLTFLAWLYILVKLFFPGYPKLKKMPVMINSSPYGFTDWQGKNGGYKPSMPERLFSASVFFGTIFISFLFVLVIKKLTN